MLLGVPLVGAPGCSTPEQTGIGIATGPLDQPYYAVGQGLADLLHERLHRPAWAVSTEGSIENAHLIVPRPNASAPDAYEIFNGEPYLTSSSPDRRKPARPLSRFPYKLAFMSALTPELGKQEAETDRLRTLVVLWDEYVQLVISPKLDNELRRAVSSGNAAGDGWTWRRESLIRRLEPDRLWRILAKILKRPAAEQRIFCGFNRSATRPVALALLRFLGLTNYHPPAPGPRRVDDIVTAMEQTAPGEETGTLDAAFFLAGLPTPAIEKLLRDGSRLVPLPLPAHDTRVLADPILSQLRMNLISGGTYARVGEVPTPCARAVLVTSEQFPARDAEEILNAIFEPRGGRVGQERLLQHHEAAEEIRFLTNLREWQKPRSRREGAIPLHPGARNFWKRERKDLLIAAGPLGGTSFRLGEVMAEVLTDKLHLPARVINTDGSRESLELLKNEGTHREAQPGEGEAGEQSGNGDGGSRDGWGVEENAGKLRDNPVKLAIIHNDDAAQLYAERAVERRKPRLLALLYPEVVHLLVAHPPGDGRQSYNLWPSKELPLSSLKEWLAWMDYLCAKHPKDRWQFGIAQDLWSPRAEPRAGVVGQPIPAFYSDREQLPWRDRIDYVRLSPVQIQHRILNRSITAALVSSGVPMEAVDQMLHAERYPRLWRALITPAGKASVVLPQRFRVLPLDTPELGAEEKQKQNADGGALPVPRSIQALASGNPFWRPASIPPGIYGKAQTARVDTVSEETALVCREDCPNVYNITRALVEDEVRLRSVVPGIDLRDPLHRLVPGADLRDAPRKQAPSPSIPMHADARAYYEEQGILERLPPKSAVFWEKILPGLIGLLVGIVTSIVTNHLVPQTQGWIAYLNRPGRRTREFRRRAWNTYFTEEDTREQIKQLRKLRQDVVAAFQRGELRPQHAEALEKQIREYEEQLRKQPEPSADKSG
jgi:TRAP-type uncharacterized transport system substrate-binding protein